MTVYVSDSSCDRNSIRDSWSSTSPSQLQHSGLYLPPFPTSSSPHSPSQTCSHSAAGDGSQHHCVDITAHRQSHHSSHTDISLGPESEVEDGEETQQVIPDCKAAPSVGGVETASGVVVASPQQPPLVPYRTVSSPGV